MENFELYVIISRDNKLTGLMDVEMGVVETGLAGVDLVHST